MNLKIHYTSPRFMALVDGKGDSPIKCTSIVYHDASECGIGIIYDDENRGRTWGLIMPLDLIVAWRATEILRRLDRIENETLAEVYHAGRREANVSETKSYVEPIIAKIGQSVYDEIMAMPIPEKIIRAILDHQDEENPPDLYPITTEVHAGTIQWRKEFTDVGIKHPQVIDKKPPVNLVVDTQKVSSLEFIWKKLQKLFGKYTF